MEEIIIILGLENSEKYLLHSFVESIKKGKTLASPKRHNGKNKFKRLNKYNRLNRINKLFTSLKERNFQLSSLTYYPG